MIYMCVYTGRLRNDNGRAIASVIRTSRRVRHAYMCTWTEQWRNERQTYTTFNNIMSIRRIKRVRHTRTVYGCTTVLHSCSRAHTTTSFCGTRKRYHLVLFFFPSSYTSHTFAQSLIRMRIDSVFSMSIVV